MRAVGVAIGVPFVSTIVELHTFAEGNDPIAPVFIVPFTVAVAKHVLGILV
jgi:hypothetical protein